MSGTTATNSGNTILNGDLGVWPGTAITGFGPGPGLLGPGIVNGSQYVGPGPGPAAAAQTSLTSAYNSLAGLACGTNLTGSDLGGLILNPGVYCFSSNAQLTGNLRLNEQGFDNQEFVFQIGTSLTTGTNAAVIQINQGPGGVSNNNIFWQVGSSATLGTGTQFFGDIVALSSISFNTGAAISCGAALARNGAVSLLSNTITSNSQARCSSVNVVPEPSSLILLFFGLISLGFLGRPKRRQHLGCEHGCRLYGIAQYPLPHRVAPPAHV